MSAHTLPRLHPRTGAPLRPVGYRKNGRPIFPILGGAEDAPDISKRPDGIDETAWSALGDPGKAAIVRERAARTEAEQARTAAEQARTAAEQALAAAKAAGTKPATDPATKTSTDGQPDIAAIVQQAVAAAIQPFQERDAQREAAQAAEKIRDAVVTAASERFHDASDALAQIDLTTLVDANGKADTAKVTAALDELLTRKPHLGKAVDTRRRAADGSLIGGGGGSNLSLEDRVKQQLALMNQGA